MSNKTEINNLDYLDEAVGGSFYDTINDGFKLRLLGLLDKSYPLGNSDLSAVADSWASEIEKVVASRGFRFVHYSNSNKANEYYDPDGNQITRRKFWKIFK